MFAVLLFGLSSFAPVSFPLDTLRPDSMIISGSCWDVTTGLDLKTHITVRAEGRDWPSHETDANGLFSLKVPTHAQQLTFDIVGYETVVFPVTTSGEIPNNTRFQLSIPVIRKDSQLLAGTYSPPPKRGRKSAAKGTSFFQVREARSGRRLPATVCLKYLNDGRTHCFEVDSTKVPTALALARGEDVTMEVSAQGYQSYRGSFAPSELENQLYQIRLLPLNNPILALAYEMPENKQFRYEIRKPGNSTFSASFNAPVPYLSSNSVRPDEDYQLTIYDEGNRLVRQETFTINPGLNFKTIRLKKPATSTPAASILHRDYTAPTYDSVVLYFDQSTYHLRQATQPTLDSVAWLLARQPGLRAHLTGHTDNVGQRALNQTLSEYRARVVSHYLKQRGVAPERLVPTGRGSDSPAAPNDSEANKSKNRRVVVRLQP